jgi:hydroxyacylglutathione hydrolase
VKSTIDCESIMPNPDEDLRIEPIPAFRDNYIWLLERHGHAVVVDPGDAAPVQRVLAERALHLDAIVVTHHHADHTGGVGALARGHRARVYGPRGSPFTAVDVALAEGDGVELLGAAFHVLAVPGHTLDHIAYWSPVLEALFCGDTLFACGCGRLFEGTAAQMAGSLAKIAALPERTRVFCAHEYTSANIRFALAVEPGNVALQQRGRDCADLRRRELPTVPSTLLLEKQTNPFLRAAQPAVQRAAHAHDPLAGTDAIGVFAALRAWKDGF